MHTHKIGQFIVATTGLNGEAIYYSIDIYCAPTMWFAICKVLCPLQMHKVKRHSGPERQSNLPGTPQLESDRAGIRARCMVVKSKHVNYWALPPINVFLLLLFDFIIFFYHLLKRKKKLVSK